MSRHERAPILPLVVVLGAGLALAVPPHGTLYIKAKNTHLKASSDLSASTLLILQPGREVTYEGREPGTPWCRVTVATEAPQGLRGVIFQANLSTSPPSREVTSKNPLEPLSPEAFASSGAAIKAVGPGTLEYGKTLSREKSAEELEALVKLANGIGDDDVAAYAAQGGLPQVMGTTQLKAPQPEVPAPAPASTKAPPSPSRNKGKKP